MEITKILSIIIVIVMITIMYLIFNETEKKQTPESELRKFILIYCIVLAFVLGFIINLNI